MARVPFNYADSACRRLFWRDPRSWLSFPFPLSGALVMRDLAFRSGVLLAGFDEPDIDTAEFPSVSAAHFHYLNEVHKAERFPFRMVLSPIL